MIDCRKCEEPEPWAQACGWTVPCELPLGHAGNHRHGLDVWFRRPIIMSIPAGWTYRIPRIDEGGWPTRDAAGEV